MEIIIKASYVLYLGKSESPFFAIHYVPIEYAVGHVKFYDLVNGTFDFTLKYDPLKDEEGKVKKGAYMGFKLFSKTINEWGEVCSKIVGSCRLYFHELYHIYRSLQGNKTTLTYEGIEYTTSNQSINITKDLRVNQDRGFRKGKMTFYFDVGSFSSVLNEESWYLNWFDLFNETEEVSRIKAFTTKMESYYMSKLDNNNFGPNDPFLKRVHLPWYDNDYARVPGVVFILNMNVEPMSESWYLNVLHIVLKRLQLDKYRLLKTFYRQIENPDVLIEDFLTLGLVLGHLTNLYDNTLPYDDDFVNENIDGSRDQIKMIEDMESSHNQMTADCEDSTHGCMTVYNGLIDGVWNDPLLKVLRIMAKYFYSIFQMLSVVTKKSLESKKSNKAAHIHPLMFPKYQFFEHLNANYSYTSHFLSKRSSSLYKDIDEYDTSLGKLIKTQSGDTFFGFEKGLYVVLMDGTGLTDGIVTPMDRYISNRNELENKFYQIYFTDIIQSQMEKVPSSSRHTSLNCFESAKRIMNQKSFNDKHNPSRMYLWTTTMLSNEFLIHGWTGFFLIDRSNNRYGIRYEDLNMNRDNYAIEPIYQHSREDIDSLLSLTRITEVPIPPVRDFSLQDYRTSKGESLRRLNNDLSFQDMLNSWDEARNIMEDLMKQLRSKFNTPKRGVRLVSFFYIVNDVSVDGK